MVISKRIRLNCKHPKMIHKRLRNQVDGSIKIRPILKMLNKETVMNLFLNTRIIPNMSYLTYFELVMVTIFPIIITGNFVFLVILEIKK